MHVPDLVLAPEPGGDDVVDEELGVGDDVGGAASPCVLSLSESRLQSSLRLMVPWAWSSMMVALAGIGFR